MPREREVQIGVPVASVVSVGPIFGALIGTVLFAVFVAIVVSCADFTPTQQIPAGTCSPFCTTPQGGTR